MILCIYSCKVGKGHIIIVGTAIDQKAMLKLVDRKPICEASSNIDLVERVGNQKGIIATDIEGKEGYIILEKEYYDILNEKTVYGRIDMKPYESLILKEI